MSSKILWLCSGLAGGVALTLGIQAALKEPETAERRPAVREATRRIGQLEKENKRLSASLDEMGREFDALRAAKVPAPEPKKPEDAPPSEEKPSPNVLKEIGEAEIKAEIDAFGEALSKVIMGQDATAEVARLRAFVKRGGKRVLEEMGKQLKDPKGDVGTRSMIAHALAQSGDPEGIAILDAILRDPDSGMLEHRLASHGLAFTDDEAAADILARVARDEAEDQGARANAAFGMARGGVEEGYDLYLDMTDKAIGSGDPAGLAYLGGVALLGKPVLPYVRQRLLTYEEPQALITLIEIVKSQRDKDAIPNLEKLAYDSTRPEAVQKAAKGALDLVKAG